jgi:hypothetical protein
VVVPASIAANSGWRWVSQTRANGSKATVGSLAQCDMKVNPLKAGIVMEGSLTMTLELGIMNAVDRCLFKQKAKLERTAFPKQTLNQ